MAANNATCQATNERLLERLRLAVPFPKMAPYMAKLWMAKPAMARAVPASPKDPGCLSD